MKIIPLNEGVFHVSNDKEFYQEGEALPNDGKGFLTMAICPFLIELPNDLILIDTGLGFLKNGTPVIRQCIENAGYKVENITKVLLSHLHKDHTDGLGYFENGVFIQNFPQAAIYVQERELDNALTQSASHSYNQEVLQQLGYLDNIKFMNDDKGHIGDFITYEVTSGHSPFHQVFWIEHDGEIAFFGGDNLPQLAYLKYHIAYKTDFDGKKAMELRQKWEKQALENNWSLLFYHDVKRQVVKLNK
ncbi:MBL fold metallo-hydrolase [Flavobacterium psychrotrophum]|uniref:MBL fold metallo-hydrolase n=1 Tax=Flavobacterium psychrotrophum TaxID=2294119 RepID=UPI000E320090|nr:MBL fold metallo-hydrolase [Flavobacterium psychrotrophum]